MKEYRSEEMPGENWNGGSYSLEGLLAPPGYTGLGRVKGEFTVTVAAAMK
jgi:hypothetical protein